MMKGEKRCCAIYTTCSSSGQQTDSQENELREFAERRGWNPVKTFSDFAKSGARKSRPAVNELLNACRQRKFDVALVWKFDRFARSVKMLVTTLHEFHELRIHFVSLTEAIDTSEEQSPSWSVISSQKGQLHAYKKHGERANDLGGLESN